jgi:hypothetical protein
LNQDTSQSLSTRYVPPPPSNTVITTEQVLGNIDGLSLEALQLQTPRKNRNSRTFQTLQHTEVTPLKRGLIATVIHYHVFNNQSNNEMNLKAAVKGALQDIQAGRTEQSILPNPVISSSNSITARRQPKTRTFTLPQTGAKIVFTEQDLPIPSNISWADDISRLFRDWNNSTSEMAILVKGIRVPPRYWSRLYRGIIPDSWDVVKQLHSEAKVRNSRTRNIPSQLKTRE